MPSGVSIQAAGIQPDIVLADLALSQRDTAPTPVFGERDLRNHLKGVGETDGVLPPPHADGDVQQDYALNEALNALKALALRSPPKAPPAPGKRQG